jgi:hypothetical protein
MDFQTLAMDGSGKPWGLTVFGPDSLLGPKNVLFEVPAGQSKIVQYPFKFPSPNATQAVSPSRLMMMDRNALFLQTQAPYSGHLIQVTP